MHERTLEFRLEEVPVVAGSSLVGQTLRQTHLRDRTGALVLAMRRPDGSFQTNPPPDTLITADLILIAIGTQAELGALVELVAA